MAEYNKKRLFWIKLTDRFMSSDTVDYLMSQKDGANYVVLYQMLCLKTVNNEGILASSLGEIIIPYNEEKIVRDCKYFSIDTVRIALNLYVKLGLIYEQEDGMLRISDFDKLIGSTTEGAEKKQLQLERRKQNQEQLGGKQGGTKVENFPPEKDIDKEKDIYKEQELDNKVSKQVSSKEKELNNNQCVRAHACESYDEIFDDLEVSKPVRTNLINFINHLKLNFGIVMLNDRLKNIILKLDMLYKHNEVEKCTVIRQAVANGYKRLEIED